MCALQKDRPARICCFSPCIEQVIRTVTSLGANGFSGKRLASAYQSVADSLFGFAEITMYEALTRQYEPFSQPDDGPKSVQDMIAKLKSVVEKKDTRRLQQIERAKAKKESKDKPAKAEGSKEGEKVEGESKQAVQAEKADENADEERPAKKARLDQDVATNGTAAAIAATEASTETAKEKTAPAKKDNARPDKRKSKIILDSAVLRPMPQLRGHTSYLTFATLMPLPEKKADGPATVEEVSTESAEPVKVTAKAAPAINGLKKTESLVQLPDEDVEMLAEGVSFDLPQSLDSSK